MRTASLAVDAAIAFFAERPAPGAIPEERVAAFRARGPTVAAEENRPVQPGLGSLLRIHQDREVYGEGDDAVAFFKVVSGVIRTCKFLCDGRRQIIAFHLPGDVFGFEMTAQRKLSAEAVCESVVTSHPRRGIETLAATSPLLAYQLFLHAMRKLAEAQDHSLLLGNRSAVEKVVSFIVEWSTHSPDNHVITLEMSRLDIAHYLGLTIETVSRTLSYLEREGLIEVPTVRQIVLKDSVGLRLRS